MKITFYLSMFLLALSMTSSAQLITLRGRVTDAETGKAVPGASILSGSFGTSADSSGNFVFYVQQSVIEESGVTASSIGYQTIHLTDITDDYNISMTPVIEELKTVSISPGVEYIVQKAYRRIANNYLDKNFNITGFELMQNSVRDIFGYQYYYLNNAEIKLYMSSYIDTPRVAQIGLMAREDKEIRNPNALRINFTGGYTLILSHDYVHKQFSALKGNPDNYTYSLNRKEWINGIRVYVVNFFSRSKNLSAGILYIDTASYAFVKILYNKYNLKVKGAIDLDKVTSYAQYKKYGNKWALDVVKYNCITDDKGYDVERTDEFQAATINVKTAALLPAETVILLHSPDSKVLPYDGFTVADKKMPKDIRRLVNKIYSKIKIPKIAKQCTLVSK